MPWTERTILLDAVLKAQHETIIFMEGWYDFFVTNLFLPTNSIAQSPANEKQNAIGRQKMFQPIAYDQWLYRRRESGGLNWSRKDISALDLQCLPPGSGHGSPKRGITRLYGRIFPERFVTKNSYQPSIKIIVSCGAFKTASSGMVRLVHGTHPLNKIQQI